MRPDSPRHRPARTAARPPAPHACRHTEPAGEDSATEPTLSPAPRRRLLTTLASRVLASRVPASRVPAGRVPASRDGGVVTVFTALAALALLLMVGLVVDGAGRTRALGRADRIAAEAARAGAEAADTRGPGLVLDRPAARAAAADYLQAAGVTGTVTVTDPRTVTVVVTVTGTDVILGLVGPGTYAVTGSAEATLSVGVETGDSR